MQHQEILERYNAAKSKYDAAAAGYESSRSKIENVSHLVIQAIAIRDCSFIGSNTVYNRI